MKICLITTNLNPVPDVKGGAIEGIVTNIVKEQEIKNKIDLTVVSIYDKDAYLESKKYKNTKFIYIKINLKYVFTSIFYKLSNKIFKTNLNTYNHFVYKKIKKYDYDYVIAEGGHYESYKKFLKTFSKEQLILHLHHQLHTNPIIEETFSKVIGVSDYITRDFTKSSKNIKGYTLLNCINIDRFDKKITLKEEKEIKNKFGFYDDDFIISFCGRLIKEKGILELIKAVKKINNPNIKLMIMGSSAFLGGKENNFTELLKKETIGYESIIKFTGYINNWDIYKYFSISSIFVFPSICEDAAGLSAIEAMVCKKPIIATNSGGVIEYLNEKSSIIVDKSNVIDNLVVAINKFYNERDNLKNMGEISYKHALKFNASNYYDNFINLMSRIGELENGKEK